MAIAKGPTAELVAVLDGVRENLEWLTQLRKQVGRIQSDIEELLPSISGAVDRLEKDRRELKRMLPEVSAIDTQSQVGNAVVVPIVGLVAAHFDWSIDEIFGRGREPSLCLARHIAIFLVRKYSRLATTDIGDVFDNRDHSTVVHSIKTARALRATNPRVWSIVAELDTIIENMILAT